MFDEVRLQEVLASYKQDFVAKHWDDEKYKWIAVKCFQDNWDVNAQDFPEMLTRSFAKTYNLLASNNNFPAKMVLTFAQSAPEEVRGMFLALFDEAKDVIERILTFKDQASILLEKYGNGAKQHYQHENAISTYLWLRYPDQYYIYKLSEITKVADFLNSDCHFKKGAYADNLRNFYKLYDGIYDYIKTDNQLIGLFQEQLTEDCYPDFKYHTLTFDIGFYISRSLKAKEAAVNEWFPADYSPALSVDDWVHLLQDPEVFTANALAIMKRMKHYGGQATCTQLSIKYGESANFYNSGSTSLAHRVSEKSRCPVMEQDGEIAHWWTILYLGKDADKDNPGTYTWKLRDELSKAIEKVNLTDVPLYADPSPSIWKISHGTEATGISQANKLLFEERHVVVVHSTTKAKAQSKVTQGQGFMYAMKKGDFFYLCYGSHIQLLGRILSNEPTSNPEMGNGWYEREYEVIALGRTTAPYTGTKKWWTPNDNSTCIKIGNEDRALFEELILSPYFNMTMQSLMGEESAHRGCWWLNANPKIWSFSDLNVGETQFYTPYNANGHKRRIFQNFLDVKVGDIVLGYESNPVKQIVCICQVVEIQAEEKIVFKKLEGLSTPIDYATIKDIAELKKMEFMVNPNGSLFKLTPGEYEFLIDLIRDENPLPVEKKDSVYTKSQFLVDVYMPEYRYDRLVAVLENKKNIILQGAPGVGKTFAAKRLAYAMMQEEDENRIEFVQFHQNYSYEDFMMGYKPAGDGFELKYGIFYRFCQKAANQPGKKFFFIIDEINRGNMSKIFGELLMLIEKDYRGTKATLAYNGLAFMVPENLYIIGMMNTADRSLAMIDYALRRRFSFFDMVPGFDSKGFSQYQNTLANETFNLLISKIDELNKEISKDKSLGKGFCIGHSYFCNRTPENCTDQWMQAVVDYDIMPMLGEYWFDDETKLQRWENIFHGVFQ